MYMRLVYYQGDRSLVESIITKGIEGLTGDRTFFLNGVDNDGDALRFHFNDGSHYDMIFLQPEHARAVYLEILQAVRERRELTEMDIRNRQIAGPSAENPG